jgi:hypothetical protein
MLDITPKRFLVQRKFILASVVFAFCGSAIAADRSEKIRGLMEAQGLNTTFEQMLQSGREQGRSQANQMLAQLMSGLNPPDEIKAKLQVALTKFMDDVEPPWGSKEIVEIWSQFYGTSFTDDELDQLLAFYTSTLAQKEVVSSRRALGEFMAALQKKNKLVLENANATYLMNLQSIVRECKCAK